MTMVRCNSERRRAEFEAECEAKRTTAKPDVMARLVAYGVLCGALVGLFVGLALMGSGCTSSPVGHGELGIGYNAQRGTVFVYSRAYKDEQDAKAEYKLSVDKWLSDAITEALADTDNPVEPGLEVEPGAIAGEPP